MLFKDLKTGYPIYILIKGDEMRAIQGKVVNVSKPYFPNLQPGQIPSIPSTQTAQMVVDVTIDADGKTNTYSIPETLSVTYANNIVLSTDRDGILHDVEATKDQSLEVVNSVEKHKAIVDSCDKILEGWNPAFAEKKEQDKRISGLETEVKDVKTEVKGLSKMISDFINEFKK